MPVLMMLIARRLPKKSLSATATPMETPINRLIKVAVPDIFRDSHVMPITSGSRLINK